MFRLQSKRSRVAIASEDAERRVKAIADETRRDIIAVLYTRGPLFNNQIAQIVNVKSGHLAYHLNLLVDAGYVRRKFTNRVGRSFALYSVTDSAIRFLDFIDARKKLDDIREKRVALTRSYCP
ncbi:MAG: helix-turn-helix transcriptional regulator [Nitrososphaerota archaeon]|nr:helix-turn-helix transcriptional regulator [Nitrososphaerota archaeon]